MRRDDYDVTKLDFSRIKGNLYGRSQELSQLEEVYRRVAGGQPTSWCKAGNQSLEAQQYEANDDDGSVEKKNKHAAATCCPDRGKNHSSSTLQSLSWSKNNTEFVLISGYAGTGKSSLVQHLKENPPELDRSNHGGSRSQRSCFFVSGKFDPLRNAEPYSAIAAAFGELCDLILDDDNECVQSLIRDSIKKAIGPVNTISAVNHCRGFAKIIPQLRRIISVDESSDTKRGVGGSFRSSQSGKGNLEAQNRFHLIFRAVVRAICAHCRIVVLFIDDLQWADQASLDVVRSLMADVELKNLLLIGSYRENEVTDCEEHPLSACLREIEQMGVVGMTKIHLDDLDLGSVNLLISDLLHVEPGDTQPLAEVVHKMTQGNLFFVLQFLKNLQDEGLLHFSLQTFRWTWANAKDIYSTLTVTNNIVELMVSNIRKLPQQMQAVLMVASCLGSVFTLEVMEWIVCGSAEGFIDEKIAAQASCISLMTDRDWWHSNIETPLATTTKNDLVTVIDESADEGWLERIPGEGSVVVYKFIHDRIQQAAYSLLPDGPCRELLHLRIGERIWNRVSSSETNEKDLSEWISFLVVNQVNRGYHHIADPNHRLVWAEQNLRVGKNAVASSAFVPAASYFTCGINLLAGTNYWEENYELSLELHTSLAKMEYCIGNFEKSHMVVEKVLSNARTLDDKIEAYYVLMDSLRTQEKYKEAVDVGFGLLEMLGERFPRRAYRISIFKDFIETKRLLRGMTDSNLLTLPTMKNRKKTAAMEIVRRVGSCSVFLNSEFVPLLATRMVQMTVRYGISSHSSVGFAVYAMFLCGPGGDLKEGYRFGKLALSLLDGSAVTKSHSIVRLLVYGFVNHWREHIQQSLDPLLYGHEIAMNSGATDVAMQCASLYCLFYVYSGMPLTPVEKDMRSYHHQMIEYRQDAASALLLPIWQFVLNLMGRSKNPMVLRGEAMDQDKMSNDAYKTGNMFLVFHILSLRTELAYFFGDIMLAKELAERSRASKIQLTSCFLSCRFTFIDGLIAFSMAKETRNWKWLNHGRMVMKQMRNWAKSMAGNTLHMLLLLKAEYASVRKRSEYVRQAYDLAISIAGRNGFLHDQALANERAGLFFLDSGDKYWASIYLSRSHKLYCEWGAQAKADYLHCQHASLFIPDERKESGLGQRSRPRFVDKSVSHKDFKPNVVNLLRST